MPKTFASVLVLAVTVSSLLAKDNIFETVNWRDSGPTVLRFSFAKVKDGGGMGKEHTYLTDTIAENVSDKTIGNANFSLYVFDKSNARIGEGYINLANVGPGQTVKFQITLSASVNPFSVAVSASPPRSLSITVTSVPQGAVLKVEAKRRAPHR